MKNKKTILVAPLHWGLGHATRCIPIIRSLLNSGYNVLIGSDGAALMLLQKEFPALKSIILPSYDINYAKKGSSLKLKLLLKIPHILKTISAEKRAVKQLIADNKIHGIISDNRPGVRSTEIPSAYVTHQLQVLSGNTTLLTTKLHQNIISKFTECWVPDVAGPVNLSGKLGHLRNQNLNLRYIGLLSRMTKTERPKKYDVLCLLSGPEPQRSLLEDKLLDAFKISEKNVALVQGKVGEHKTQKDINGITVYNFMETAGLEKLINESDMVVSRSGYTTIMDLAVLQKPAYFIPTPGQHEQLYLAKRLNEQKIIPSCKQDEFKEEELTKIKSYKGFEELYTSMDLSEFFGLFEGK